LGRFFFETKKPPTSRLPTSTAVPAVSRVLPQHSAVDLSQSAVPAMPATRIQGKSFIRCCLVYGRAPSKGLSAPCEAQPAGRAGCEVQRGARAAAVRFLDHELQRAGVKRMQVFGFEADDTEVESGLDRERGVGPRAEDDLARGRARRERRRRDRRSQRVQLARKGSRLIRARSLRELRGCPRSTCCSSTSP
jgi:hypothetical protein